ncbi:MAG TPA: ribosome maturation factor RimP [Gemmatimonadota bacterium]|nr:ribosome maturation factor RimP [Gemmatimonadota bacterium]
MARLTALIEPVLQQAGAELVDLEVSGGGGRPLIRAYVDAETGITLDDCARLSRRIEAALETAAAVPERYVLEVSSPGIERRLTRRRHFERYTGREVAIRLFAKQDGRRRFVGSLERVLDRGDGSFAIVVSDSVGGSWTFGADEIAKARLHVSW